ncbi:unnamed protein product [Danaus chrysippus]|uniref:(African queen) hypothetical protein n=1 Tax=Danaus chrysippus TaxID=151541 RepID=A0A8J2QSN8_9NEOP|nr:unnamed protein product [Danaus chrysippus]
MKSCRYCKRRFKKNSEISFHRFPKDLEERKVWLQNMRITNWTPKAHDSLCSLHFVDECFKRYHKRVLLKPGSIPTIFEGISIFPLTPRLAISMSLPRLATTNSANISTVSAIGKISCDANITELSNKTKKGPEEVTNHDYEVSSTSKKSRTEFGRLPDHHYNITPKKSSSKKLQQELMKLRKIQAKCW